LERVIFAFPIRRPTSLGTWIFRMVDTGGDVVLGGDEDDDDDTTEDDETESGEAASVVFGVDCAHAVTASSRAARIATRRMKNRLLSILSPPTREAGSSFSRGAESNECTLDLHSPPRSDLRACAAIPAFSRNAPLQSRSALVSFASVER